MGRGVHIVYSYALDTLGHARQPLISFLAFKFCDFFFFFFFFVTLVFLASSGCL